VIHGAYVNFAICEYYNDHTFSTLAQAVLKMISGLDHKTICGYAKVQEVVFESLYVFINSQFEVMMMTVDFATIASVIRLLVAMVSEPQTTFDASQHTLSCINAFTHSVFETLHKASSSRTDQLIT
jgi:hypothetical protein